VQREEFLKWLYAKYPNFHVSGVQYRYIEAYLTRDNKAKFQWPNKIGKTVILKVLEEYEASNT